MTHSRTTTVSVANSTREYKKQIVSHFVTPKKVMSPTQNTPRFENKQTHFINDESLAHQQ